MPMPITTTTSAAPAAGGFGRMPARVAPPIGPSLAHFSLGLAEPVLPPGPPVMASMRHDAASSES